MKSFFLGSFVLFLVGRLAFATVPDPACQTELALAGPVVTSNDSHLAAIKEIAAHVQVNEQDRTDAKAFVDRYSSMDEGAIYAEKQERYRKVAERTEVPDIRNYSTLLQGSIGSLTDTGDHTNLSRRRELETLIAQTSRVDLSVLKDGPRGLLAMTTRMALQPFVGRERAMDIVLPQAKKIATLRSAFDIIQGIITGIEDRKRGIARNMMKAAHDVQSLYNQVLPELRRERSALFAKITAFEIYIEEVKKTNPSRAFILYQEIYGDLLRDLVSAHRQIAMVSSAIVQIITGFRLDESLFRAAETLQKETSLEIQLAMAALVQAQEQRRTFQHLKLVEATHGAVLDVSSNLIVSNATEITNLSENFQANIIPFLNWQTAVQEAARIYQEQKIRQVETTKDILTKIEAGVADSEAMAENYYRSVETQSSLTAVPNR